MKPLEKSWKGHNGKTLDTKNAFDIIDCRECGFVHCVPIPTSTELTQIYRDEYYSTEKPFYFQYMEEDSEWWKLAYGDRFDTFEENLLPGRRRLLDIGSGPGYFLRLGKERGWQCVGIEPSRQAAAYSRKMGLDIVEEFLTADLAKKVGAFDAIHLSEMLEHVPDPIQMVHLIHEMLLPGGMICIVVPNDYNPFQHVLREVSGFEPWWLAAPHHINYFSHASLKGLIAGAGFEVVLSESTFPIDLFLLFGDNYVGNDELGRACHMRRKKFELSLSRGGANSIKRQIYRDFAELGIGREIVLFGKKR